MTEYGFAQTRRMSPPTDTVQEKKAARKRLLEAVLQRRREIYVRWYKKMQLKAANKLDTIS